MTIYAAQVLRQCVAPRHVLNGKPIDTKSFVTEWHHLLDYDYDNDNRSAIASLTTSCFPAQQAVEVLMEIRSPAVFGNFLEAYQPAAAFVVNTGLQDEIEVEGTPARFVLGADLPQLFQGF